MKVQKKLKKGDYVRINLGYKTVFGTIVKADDSKYVEVKHDNFASEIFKKNQVEIIEKELKHDNYTGG